jgi:O-antigen/teichoic acid export membrane protein
MISQDTKPAPASLVAENLTKKATLNSLALALDYGGRIAVALLLTPWMVAGLGDYFFGVWQVLNRLVGYMTPTSGKPTEVLKSTIANQQSSTAYELKRRYVGATVLLWLFFLPIIGVFGSSLAWYAPYWIHASNENIGIVRIATGILVVNLAAISIANTPQAVLEGENQGYKRIGLSFLLILLGGVLTWLALLLHYGIIGVASIAVLSTLLSGLLYLFITRHFVGWFGLAVPSRAELFQFARLSGWFLSWNMFMNIMITMDVVLLGFLGTAEMVTYYTLMKYIPEAIVGIVAILVFGTIPGLGGIIGSGDFDRASQVREELMRITWLIVTVLGTTILIWNRSFLELWVGTGYYTGVILNVLVTLLVIQFVFIRIDSYIIDVTLEIKGKLFIGVISISLSILAAVFLFRYQHLGVAGLCAGVLSGRLIMNVGFPLLVSRKLGKPFLSQIKRMWKIGMVTLISFSFACWCESIIPVNFFWGIKGWVLFIFLAGITFILTFLVITATGLSRNEKQRLRIRLNTLLANIR